MVGICDAVAIGAVSLGRRRCPGPLLGLVFSACSGVVLQSVRVGVVVLGSLVLAVWVGLSFSSVRVLYPSLVVAGCLRMLLLAAVGRLPTMSAGSVGAAGPAGAAAAAAAAAVSSWAVRFLFVVSCSCLLW